MSLDISKLKNARERSGKIIARCPACAEADHDRKGEHLVVNEDGRFGCVVYPGDGPEAREHRSRIFALCGDHGIRPLAVQPSSSASVSRTARTPVRESFKNFKTGLLGRLGRRFAVHAHSFEPNKSPIHDAKKSVVNSREASQPSLGTPRTGIDLLTTDFLHHRRTLTERELSILRAAGAENDPIILDAINLFNATVADYSEKPITQTELNL
jgi:hypothetical protein